ncbi:MAG: DUF1800 domain-containing protein [Bacteroidetes bacterium]|nr:DUF1800 domain-containing protein [Bacteroidota bacterium]
MNPEDVIHLMNRAGFGCSYEETRTPRSRQDRISDLFTGPENLHLLEAELPPVESLDNRKMSGRKKRMNSKDQLLRTVEVNRLWFNHMIETDDPLREKMTLFWTNHFVVDHKTPLSALPYNNLLRSHALGNFGELTKAVAKSPSMINYLHLRQNVKDAPNEDFARELCELFTLGRDNVYTEQDIKEIARAFTGWKFDLQLNYRFVPRQHDFGTKTIFGQRGNFGGEEVIDLILEQKETALFLSRKLYRFFVNDQVSASHVQELADTLYANDYEIRPWLEHLFSADWFYAMENRNTRIKSPTELLVGMARQMGFYYPDGQELIRLQRILGEVLFDPPNVAGWPGGRHWIDSTRLILRMQLGFALLQGAEMVAYETDPLDTMPDQAKAARRVSLNVGTIDLNAFQNTHRSPEEEQLALFGKRLSAKATFSEDLKERLAQYTSFPEYQLC